MGRALREHPRATVAKLLGLVLVAVIGALLALSLDGEPKAEVPPEAKSALTRARREVRSAAGDAREERARGERLEAASNRLRSRLRAAERRERRLRRALRRAASP